MDKTLKILITIFTIFIIVLLFLYINIFVDINAKQYPIIVEIEQGENLKSISQKLKDNNIIYNKTVFTLFVKILNQDERIKTGEYTFKKPINNVELLYRLIKADYQYDAVSIIIKEGQDYRDIIDIIYNFKNIKKNYTREELIEILKQKEGYLFPETYKFPPFANLDKILKDIDNEFNQRIRQKYNLTEEELQRVLTIASILEKEVQSKDDMKIVSGVIKNRLEKNMPLQMDSTLEYIINKSSSELTLKDLRIDSLYNTYKIKGLPVAPIGNPGQISIEAALNPDKNDYLFFLTDKNGVNHYAKTYAEHLRNKKKYLD